jgi:hypothetical protein
MDLIYLLRISFGKEFVMNPLTKKNRRSASGESNPAQSSMVRLEPPSREPTTPVERVVVSVLKAAGAMPLGSLVERVASELYNEELRHGAWVLDIGLFGSSLFVPDVVSEIEARNGTLWRIDDPERIQPQPRHG